MNKLIDAEKLKTEGIEIAEIGDDRNAVAFNLCVSSKKEGITLEWSEGEEEIVKSPLSAEETNLLEECEAQVTENLPGHIKTAIALSTIQSKKLYRQQHSTFEAYLKAKFDIGRAHGYRVIATGKAASQLSLLGDVSKLPATLLQRFGKLSEEQKKQVIEAVTEDIDGEATPVIEKQVLDKAIDEVAPKAEPKPTKPKVNFTELLEKVSLAYELHGDPEHQEEVEDLLLELKDILGKLVKPVAQQG